MPETKSKKYRVERMAEVWYWVEVEAMDDTEALDKGTDKILEGNGNEIDGTWEIVDRDYSVAEVIQPNWDVWNENARADYRATHGKEISEQTLAGSRLAMEMFLDGRGQEIIPNTAWHSEFIVKIGRLERFFEEAK